MFTQLLKKLDLFDKEGLYKLEEDNNDFDWINNQNISFNDSSLSKEKLCRRKGLS